MFKVAPPWCSQAGSPWLPGRRCRRSSSLYESGLRKVPLAASLTLRRLENTKAPARYCRSFITISSAGPPAEVLLI